MHTMRYTSHISVTKLLHVSAPRCRPQRDANTKDYKNQHKNHGSTMPSILRYVIHYFYKLCKTHVVRIT